MILWILWGACSVVVFRHVIVATIKEELETWGEVDSQTLILMTLLAFMTSLFGPFAIAAYLIYNVIEGIAQAISENYKKPKENNEWRYKSDSR